MSATLKFGAAVVTVTCIVPISDSAFAVSAKIARHCEALTAKAFPAREMGNPAAGSAKGTGRQEEAYFKKCVANKGKVPAPRN